MSAPFESLNRRSLAKCGDVPCPGPIAVTAAVRRSISSGPLPGGESQGVCGTAGEAAAIRSLQ